MVNMQHNLRNMDKLQNKAVASQQQVVANMHQQNQQGLPGGIRDSLNTGGSLERSRTSLEQQQQHLNQANLYQHQTQFDFNTAPAGVGGASQIPIGQPARDRAPHSTNSMDLVPSSGQFGFGGPMN